jgi:hypothetical protein
MIETDPVHRPENEMTATEENEESSGREHVRAPHEEAAQTPPASPPQAHTMGSGAGFHATVTCRDVAPCDVSRKER